MSPEAKARLIFRAEANFRSARWWTLAAAWAFGHHLLVPHLGLVARIALWRGTPYLLALRRTP